MKRFTDGLMDFSKLESRMVEYDLRTVIQEVVFSLKPQKRFSSVKFVTRFDPELPLLSMDVGQIKQVFLNLFNNAAEAINTLPQAKGTIAITTSYLEEEEKAEVKIKDTGHGIPEELLEKIFEPRFTTKKHGHGFGLVTCQRVIRNHRGKITVESGTGQGTTFTITLPVKQPDGSGKEEMSEVWVHRS
jgi:signal transduction histidine kinase